MTATIVRGREIYLHPLINDSTDVLLEVSASVAPSDTMMRLKLMIPAAPSPCKARPASNMLHDCAVAQSTLPIVIQNISNCSAKWRPYMSASWPDAGMNVVNVRV
jgi:hypothetical protein